MAVTTEQVNFRCPKAITKKARQRGFTKTEGGVRLFELGLEMDAIAAKLDPDFETVRETVGLTRAELVAECVAGMFSLLFAKGKAQTPLLMESYASGLLRRALEQKRELALAERHLTKLKDSKDPRAKELRETIALLREQIESLNVMADEVRRPIAPASRR